MCMSLYDGHAIPVPAMDELSMLRVLRVLSVLSMGLLAASGSTVHLLRRDKVRQHDLPPLVTVWTSRHCARTRLLQNNLRYHHVPKESFDTIESYYTVDVDVSSDIDFVIESKL